MYFTILCTVLALFGCGATYWFPFREEKAQHTNMQSIIGAMTPGSKKAHRRVLDGADYTPQTSDQFEIDERSLKLGKMGKGKQ